MCTGNMGLKAVTNKSVITSHSIELNTVVEHLITE